MEILTELQVRIGVLSPGSAALMDKDLCGDH